MSSFENSFLFDEDNDEYNEEQDNFFQGGSFRDSTLFLVDCSISMFEKVDGEDMTLFQKCMKAIQNMYQHKIYGSDKDFLGIVFFGTEKNNTGEDFLHMFMLQDLEQPSAERIKKIETFSQDFKPSKFKSEYGHSNDFALDKVFWYCSNLFSLITQKIDTKRLMMFTRRSNPHDGNKIFEKLAKNKAKDLNDIGIALEIIPLVIKGEEFDYSQFYGDILMLSEEQIKALPDPAENFDELEKTVRSKYYKRRPYTHLNLILNDELSISCSLFNLVRECPKPNKLKLDKKTNVETKSVTRRYIPETGEILFNSDTKLALDIFDKRITFEQDEIKSIKRFGLAGMKLLGFKSLVTLKPYMYVKPGHFIYPDEKLIEGSTTLFSAFLNKCLEKGKYMLCEVIPRVNASPRLAALCPQQEEMDENRMQIIPPGFHLIYLPFADDFRQIDRKITAKSTTEDTDLFRKCIGKLKFKYNPEDFKNPAIQKLWSEIEAVALDRNEPEEIVDLTVPNNERIEKRAGQYLEEFAKKFSLTANSFAKSKRKTDTDLPGVKKLKQNETTDVETEAKANRLEKLTIPILKEYMKTNKISALGTKKDDLIKSIKLHLNL